MRLKPALQECFDGLENGEHARLVIESAPPPDETVGHVPGKWWMRPGRLGPRFDRNDVHVGHQEHRRSCSIEPFPGEQQTVAADHLASELPVNLRKARLQEFMKPVEAARVGARRLGAETVGIRTAAPRRSSAASSTSNGGIGSAASCTDLKAAVRINTVASRTAAKIRVPAAILRTRSS